MNYITEITAFQRLVEFERIGPKEQALWHAMMSIANSLGWPEAFTVANLTLQSKAGLTERDVRECRNRLVQRGLISYKQRSGNRAPTYGMVSVAGNSADNPAGKVAGKPAGSTAGKSTGNSTGNPAGKPAGNPAALDKPNETKQNETSICGADAPPRARWVPPSIEEVGAYCRERKNNVDPAHWHAFYTSKGWMVGKNPMKDWKAAVRTWERNRFNVPQAQAPGPKMYEDTDGRWL